MSLAILMLIYGGGFGYTWDRRGFFHAIVWPAALGAALASMADRELTDD